jgi:hypothetical protein
VIFLNKNLCISSSGVSREIRNKLGNKIDTELVKLYVKGTADREPKDTLNYIGVGVNMDGVGW